MFTTLIVAALSLAIVFGAAQSPHKRAHVGPPAQVSTFDDTITGGGPPG